jgi:hypothetical protein
MVPGWSSCGPTLEVRLLGQDAIQGLMGVHKGGVRWWWACFKAAYVVRA